MEAVTATSLLVLRGFLLELDLSSSLIWSLHGLCDKGPDTLAPTDGALLHARLHEQRATSRK